MCLSVTKVWEWWKRFSLQDQKSLPTRLKICFRDKIQSLKVNVHDKTIFCDN